jgi:hypothetical protein
LVEIDTPKVLTVDNQVCIPPALTVREELVLSSGWRRAWILELRWVVQLDVL